MTCRTRTVLMMLNPGRVQPAQRFVASAGAAGQDQFGSPQRATRNLGELLKARPGSTWCK